MGRSAWRRKRRKRKIGLLPIIASIALALVIASAVVFFTDSFGFASSMRGLFTASMVEETDADGMKIIDGDYTIDSPDERLENTHIKGNLYLAEDIGDGNVDLINVTVDGSVLVRGGGLKSVFMRDCILDEVKVNRPDGRVRLVFSGKTVAESVDLETSARLVENLSENGIGVKTVQVMTEEKVELAGEFDAVLVLVREANVEIESELLNHLTVANTASDSTISYPDGIYIENLQLDGSAYLFGRGTVNQAVIAASGTSELEGHFNRVEVTAEAGFFDLIEESSFQELIVAGGALNNVFSLYDDVTIHLLELNEAVTVEGRGEIEKVLVNAPGSTMEQIPLDIEFLQAVSIMIDGHEISTPDMLYALREHGDPEYVPGEVASSQVPEPEPEPKPDPEPSSAPAEDTGEPEPEPEQEETESEPEPEPKEAGDENDSPPGFTLEIMSPSESDEILTQGKNLLYVSLNTEQPEHYQVFLGDEKLNYLEEVKQFYGLVDKEAEISELEAKIKVVPGQ